MNKLYLDRLIQFLFVWMASLAVSLGEMVSIQSSMDTTIFNDPNFESNPRSNGMGQHMFAGRTGGSNNFGIRRALVSFDIEGAVPANAIIDSAFLQLTVSRAPPLDLADPFALHRALASWGEGNSDAVAPEGVGASAQPGDATWEHRSFSNVFWTSQGGDFDPNPSATRDIRNVGTYAFFGPGLAVDVQFWVDNPSENDGWFLLGNEQGVMNAHRFLTHEGGDDDGAPTLTVTFHVIPEASTGGLMVVGVGTVLWLRRRRTKMNR